MTPAPNANDVEAGAAVSVVFNQPIDPATLTPTTFRVTLRGVLLPTTVTYDAATRTARAIAPFLPDSTYGAEVTTGVSTPSGSRLAAAEVWSFATRRWQSVTVDDAPGSVGFYASAAVGANGRVHMSYNHYYDNFDLKYATCASNCTTAGNWQVVGVDTVGGVGEHTSLAMDGSQRLHVAYYDFTNGNLKYATCAADCATVGNWQTVTADGDPFAHAGLYTAIAVTENGRIHVSYFDGTNNGLKYATCAANCTTAANWTSGIVSGAGDIGQSTSIVAEASGLVNIAYFDANRDLKYASCATSCTVGANWQIATVDTTNTLSEDISMTVDGAGRRHIGYYDSYNGDFRYATCATNCQVGANWQTVAADVPGNVGWFTSLAVDRNGRVHASYFKGDQSDLKYATCAVACTVATNWRSAIVDAAGEVGMSTSIAVEESGRINIAHYDSGNTNLKFVR